MSRKIPLVTLAVLSIIAVVVYLNGSSGGYDDRIVALSYVLFAAAFGALLTVFFTASFSCWWKVLSIPVIISICGVLLADEAGQSLGISMFGVWARFAPISLILLSLIVVISHIIWTRAKKNKEQGEIGSPTV
jgi:hypothetical protein